MHHLELSSSLGSIYTTWVYHHILGVYTPSGSIYIVRRRRGSWQPNYEGLKLPVSEKFLSSTKCVRLQFSFTCSASICYPYVIHMLCKCKLKPSYWNLLKLYWYLTELATMIISIIRRRKYEDIFFSLLGMWDRKTKSLTIPDLFIPAPPPPKRFWLGWFISLQTTHFFFMIFPQRVLGCQTVLEPLQLDLSVCVRNKNFLLEFLVGLLPWQ